MRGLGAAILLFLTAGQGMAAPLPSRIMSLTVCTDELLMDLAPPDRIASISYLSREKVVLKLWPEAARIPVNHNSVEEILAAKPDLVLTLTYASLGLRRMLAKTHTSFLEVPQAENFDQIRAVTRLLGDAIGERPRAESLIARMDATLRALSAGAPRETIHVAGWGGGGFVPGRSTLFGAVLEAAGGTNVTAQDGYYDVEALVAAKPDVLAYGDDYIGTPSLRRDQDDHPLLLKLYANRRIVYPAAYLNCGVPESADAARHMRGQLLEAMKQKGGAP